MEAHWEIQRADGETEIYNETDYYHHEELSKRGLYIEGYCNILYLEVSPTDLRYDGAQITAILDLPQCYNGFNVTESIALNIQGIMFIMYSYIITILIFKFCHSDKCQFSLYTFATGLLEAPTDVSIEVGVENMILSWSPPYTIDGVPILQYTVYIICQGHTETLNTTETHITLDKSCISTAYQISAWNEVGEGNKAIYSNNLLCKYIQYYMYMLILVNNN